MLLNLAEMAAEVTTLGPGRRVALWVQGCLFRCRNCIAQDWQSFRPAQLWSVPQLLRWVLSWPEHDGLTFSGGEPMLQARGLEALWHAVQAERPKWTLIVFSGYTGNQLREHGQAEQQKLLSSVDAFVGGPYVDVLNDGRGLRGSSNQEVWFPPQTRFTPAEQVSLREGSRRVELRMGERELLLIGVPRAGWRQPSQETKS